ncbi:MAG TPA: hypothetical protein VJ888_09545 [Mobilitalea sp.]|nr:hypothetical protein [Mobilitalea sp.]
MSYLRSLEYTEAKDRLKEEYKSTFREIEAYYIQVYTENSYEVQLTLSQIMADFLMAQEEGKLLSRIIGKDVKKYAIRMIETELSSNKGKSYWILTAIGMVWFSMFMVFFRIIMYEGYKGYSFSEKLDHIYLSIALLPIILFVLAFGYFKTKVTAILFYRRRLIKLVSILLTLPIIFLVSYYLEAEEINIGIRIPAPLFFILISVTTVVFIVAGTVSNRKTEANRRVLEAEEELEPEQVTCPSCNKSHDLDYPKCPYCGYRAP